MCIKTATTKNVLLIILLVISFLGGLYIGYIYGQYSLKDNFLKTMNMNTKYGLVKFKPTKIKTGCWKTFK